MSENPQNPPRQIKIEIPPELEPVYANMARISHSPAEIVLDFARLLPGEGQAKVSNRLVMSPVGAKMFFKALGENLARYENAFGEIRLPGDTSLADRLFRNITPPDKDDEHE